MADLSGRLQTLPTHRVTWYAALPDPQQALIELSYQLYDREERLKSLLPDYSFIVFPMSKGYEGFLKWWFHNTELISNEVYRGRRFRVGRALNPDVSERHRDEWWLFDDVSRLVGEETARQLWAAWLEGRNHVFHYFPEDHSRVTLKRARRLLDQLEAAMIAALAGHPVSSK